MATDTRVECCFLDVGQGSAAVVLLGNRRAIVVDCGPPRVHTVVRALEYYKIEIISALVVTHNDDDHCGSADSIWAAYGHAIEFVYFLEDRPTKRNYFFELVLAALERGDLQVGQIRRLEAPDVIYSDPARQVELRILFPTMVENIRHRDSGKPNATSGAVDLRCGSKSVLIPGDITAEGILSLTNGGRTPIECDVLAVPHHGGAIECNNYEDVYGSAIRCKIAIVSVGSSNQHKHPDEMHLQAISRIGARIMCTQITKKCCNALEGLRPGVSRSQRPGISSPVRAITASGTSKRVACAGSVHVEIGLSEVRIEGLDEHQRAVDRLQKSGSSPICRR